jgi:TetR/AcrR family transcriptional regulator, transcriptional repressor for nem operon
LPRVSRQQKELNREHVVGAASQGFRAAAPTELASAGLTPGGFYSHFASKEDLALELLNQGFTASLGTVDALIGAHPRSSRAALNAIIDST